MTETEIEEMKEKLDCYGFLYDPYITPCRDKCELRLLCKTQLTKNVESMGKEKISEEQRRRMEQSMQPDETAKPKGANIEYSETVLQILDVMTNLGLQIQYRAGYIAAKMNKRNVLGITKARTTAFPGAVKFVWTKDREEFPSEILEFISDKKSGDFWTCIAPDLLTLKNVLETYITAIDNKK